MLDPALSPLARADAEDDRAALAFGCRRPVRVPCRQVVGVDDLLHQRRIGEKVLGGIAGHIGAGRRNVEEGAVRRGPVLPVRRVFGKDVILLFALFEQGAALRHLLFEHIAQARQFQMVTDARAHLFNIERFGDVVGAADFEALDLFLHGIDHRDEDHGNAVTGRRRLDLPANLVAVHARHHDVEQYQIGRRVAIYRAHGTSARTGDADVVSVLQRTEQGVDVLRDVVDNHERRPAIRRGRLPRIEEQRIAPMPPQFELHRDTTVQQLRIHRLGNVVRNAQRKTARFVHRVGKRSNEDDRNHRRNRVRLQTREYRIAIHTGHLHVEQDEIGLRMPLRQIERPLAGGCCGNGVGVAQNGDERMQVLADVIDDQDVRPFSRFLIHLLLPSCACFSVSCNLRSAAFAPSMSNTSSRSASAAISSPRRVAVAGA